MHIISSKQAASGKACGSKMRSFWSLTVINSAASDNSSSSLSTSTSNSSSSALLASLSSNGSSPNALKNKANTLKAAHNDLLHRSSSASSSGDSRLPIAIIGNSAANSNERAQRRKLMQMISNYDQQNKQLQRELAKEKRRRNEELACVVKSLLCFEAKLKTDMKHVNQRLQDKDVEICRLVRQNRALRQKLKQLQKQLQESIDDEGVVEDENGELDEMEQVELRHAPKCASNESESLEEQDLLLDCLQLEALQCINCRKQFYDIETKESWSQTPILKSLKDAGSRNNDALTTEHGSSSDDTVSSSFYGARRSVRYTSKRTSGTFRDYMRSRAMNIDDPALEQNSEENTSTVSREESQSSYEKLHVYSRTMERMHGVRSSRDSEEGMSSSGGSSAGKRLERSASRLSNKSSGSGHSSSAAEKNKQLAKAAQLEEDDGIFSPTQDEEDFEEYGEQQFGSLKISAQRRSTEFSEASPKQIYETSTDDWYASASDQEESAASSKAYSCGAINPVLECVNQILLQQSMEDGHCAAAVQATAASTAEPNSPQALKSSASNSNNLPRRSSLSGRRSARSNSRGSDAHNSRQGTLNRKRVHFSTKNSMVHVPRNDEHEEDTAAAVNHSLISNAGGQQLYHSMSFQQQHMLLKPAAGAEEQERFDVLNYESIYSNEYEPIFGSEQNSCNLYVDMESNAKLELSCKNKLPPALPPKPANLLKFKKSLQQLDEMPDEHLQQEAVVVVAAATHPPAPPSSSNSTSEPDYCSISEVGSRNVQIVAQVHQPPQQLLKANAEQLAAAAAEQAEIDVEVSTVASSEYNCMDAVSQKTDEIEEIFADIPKLPNVAAIIAPKSSAKQFQANNNSSSSSTPQGDYMIMAPKQQAALGKAKLESPSSLRLQLNNSLSVATAVNQQQQQQTHNQYKRKHMPNILVEINKRMSQPNSPTTPTRPSNLPLKSSATQPSHSKSLNSLVNSLKSYENCSPSLPLQAEFDWYNLDAEYGKPSSGSASKSHLDLLKNNEKSMLAEIHEDQHAEIAEEVDVINADEYNLDEEFSLASGEYLVRQEEQKHELLMQQETQDKEQKLGVNICEALNFPLYGENTPYAAQQQQQAPANATLSGNGNCKAKKIKKNLANFEKFIEGTGMSTKTLPSTKRKLYFAGPFV